MFNFYYKILNIKKYIKIKYNKRVKCTKQKQFSDFFLILDRSTPRINEYYLIDCLSLLYFYLCLLYLFDCFNFL